MALHYLVDGYNVIHQMSQLDHFKLEAQRLGLIHHIEHCRPQGSIKNKVTIVFDGQGGLLTSQLSSALETIFSVGESADDKIKEIVYQSKNAKSIVVVTDDRDIQIAVRKSGAQISSVSEFLSKGQHKVSGKNIGNDKSGASSYKNISHTDQFNINSEMSKLWLKKNK